MTGQQGDSSDMDVGKPQFTFKVAINEPDIYEGEVMLAVNAMVESTTNALNILRTHAV